MENEEQKELGKLGKTGSGARDFDNDPGRADWAVEPDSATGQGHHTTGALEAASAAGGAAP